MSAYYPLTVASSNGLQHIDHIHIALERIWAAQGANRRTDLKRKIMSATDATDPQQARAVRAADHEIKGVITRSQYLEGFHLEV